MNSTARRSPLPAPLRAALYAPYLAVFYPFLIARRARAALRPGHSWRTWITPQLMLGGFLTPADVPELKRLGITAVVNVSNEVLAPTAALRAAGIAFHRVPCWDMRAPAIEDAAVGVEFIAERLARGERVYVHCASGVGRSVALTLCYMATHGGLEVEHALAEVVRLRPRVAMRVGQRQFVDQFVSWHRGERARQAAAHHAAERLTARAVAANQPVPASVAGVVPIAPGEPAPVSTEAPLLEGTDGAR